MKIANKPGQLQLRQSWHPAPLPAALQRLAQFPVRRLLALMPLLLAACASAPAEHFYTLQAPATPPASEQLWPQPLVLANLTLPDLVDKPQLVLRKNPQQVQIMEQRRWAEPLKGALAQALAANLRAQGMQVALTSDHLAHDSAWQLWVDVLQFESSPGKEALLEVQWQVRSASGARLYSGKGLWREAVASSDIDALIAAHQRALQQCAQEMGRSLQRLPAPTSPSASQP